MANVSPTLNPPQNTDQLSAPSVDADEVARFAAMADDWWDPNGKFKPLHAINPVRLAYIKETICHHFDRDITTARPYEGLRVLDIGCGGGLLSEPVCKLGASVTGADATEKNIRIAGLHAAEGGLDIDYRHTTAEQLASDGEKFDVIINMEVIEHVADTASFLNACRVLLKDNGIMFISTLNRTPKSYLFAIIGAEYVMRWLPKGTHNWKKFLRPSELAEHCRDAHFEMCDLKGMSFAPLSDQWSLSNDLSVNYLGYALAE